MMTRLPSIRFSSSMKNGTFSSWLRKFSEDAVLTDRLDRFLRTIDVVPACLLQVSAVVRHELHLHAVLGLFCVVGHDVRVRDVDPVVVLPVHRAAVLSLGWVDGKVGEIAASSPVTVRSLPAVGVGVVKLASAGREPTEHFKNLRLHVC